jgi:filamentous hemagglutinin
LFFNQFPDHEVYNSQTISLAQLKNINGKWNYVINSDEKLIVGKSGQFPGGGHIDLSNGQPIKAAGEVKIVNGQLKYIDNSSGHYLPSGLSARQIAEETFSKLGLDTLNKYIEKEWIEDPTIRNGGAWRPNL